MNQMKLKVFTIYDAKAEAYLQPFFLSTKGQAIRSITEALANTEHQFAKYPQDFTLFELGEYDDSNGQMLPHQAPLSLGNLLEFNSPQKLQTPTAAIRALAQ
jgi:hypothetical protein